MYIPIFGACRKRKIEEINTQIITKITKFQYENYKIMIDNNNKKMKKGGGL